MPPGGPGGLLWLPLWVSAGKTGPAKLQMNPHHRAASGTVSAGMRPGVHVGGPGRPAVPVRAL
jgi:hypothetical protein